nr:MAG TPA: hypothetical protein [Caudoviricetes sp.]
MQVFYIPQFLTPKKNTDSLTSNLRIFLLCADSQYAKSRKSK